VLGQGISAGAELFRIADTTRVWVFANLPIEEAQYFQEGDEGTIVSQGREPLTAPLTYIAPFADEETLTVQVRFDVNNIASQLKPNEYVEVRLGRAPSPVVAIPLSALTIIDGTRGAFVQRDTGFDFVAVETGQDSDGWVEVGSGVAVGDMVVTAGVFDLKSIVLQDAISGD
jgi:multidrug efflux pump subunit AcrA (membrane-fusion protein)